MNIVFVALTYIALIILSHCNHIMQNQMQKETFERYPYNSSEVSTVYRPRIKWLSSQTPVDAVAQQNPVLYPMKADDHADSVSSDGLTEESPSEESEDEIEDC